MSSSSLAIYLYSHLEDVEVAPFGFAQSLPRSSLLRVGSELVERGRLVVVVVDSVADEGVRGVECAAGL